MKNETPFYADDPDPPPPGQPQTGGYEGARRAAGHHHPELVQHLFLQGDQGDAAQGQARLCAPAHKVNILLTILVAFASYYLFSVFLGFLYLIVLRIHLRAAHGETPLQHEFKMRVRGREKGGHQGENFHELIEEQTGAVQRLAAAIPAFKKEVNYLLTKY